MFNTITRVLPVKKGWFCRFALILVFGFLIDMPSWIGDENPILFFPFFMLAFLLFFQGEWIAQLSCGLLFFEVLVAPNMMIDSFASEALWNIDFARVLLKLVFWFVIWWLVCRILPHRRGVQLSKRLWMLVGGLALAPLMTTLSFSFWNANWWDFGLREQYKLIVDTLAYTVLPFVVLSALALLFALVVLARHDELEQQKKLADLREVYYQGLKQEQSQLRLLRHDLNNHMTALHSLLEHGESDKAVSYLNSLSALPSLKGSKRFCENEMANVVLSSKDARMRSEGLLGNYSVQLPEKLPLSDPDLCALFGNALDNAIESAVQADNKEILLRIRADMGLLMLRVENAIGGVLKPTELGFASTKKDNERHGMGLTGMREIAERYGGSLEATAKDGRFELVVCIPFAD